jgi:integrase
MRRVRAADLETRAARQRLKARGKPYYRNLGDNTHLGYRKGQRRGVWVVRRYVGGESPYIMETIAEADDHLDSNGVTVLDFWQAEERARGTPKHGSGKYTVADAVSDYLEHIEGRPSWNDTKLRLAAYALPAFGTMRAERLTAATLRRWHRDLVTEARRFRNGTRVVDQSDPDAVRRRKVSANRILGLLKAVLNFAFAEGKVASDLEWRRVKPFSKVDRSRSAYLKLAECQRLLNACDPEFRLLVRAALETGARYGELRCLRVGDYDPDNGKLYIGLTKSGDSRHVTLTADGQSFFEQLTAGKPSSAPMLGRVWKPSHQLGPMRQACERAKIDPPVGFHQLRHTWASLAIKQGVPLQMVAKNLGHVDTRMVERHYGHLDEDHVTQTIRERAPRFGKVSSNVKALP